MDDIQLVLNFDNPAFILTQTDEAQTFVLNGTSSSDITLAVDNPYLIGAVGLKGPKGDKGEQGEPGETLLTDPGDLTLIFENKLI